MRSHDPCVASHVLLLFGHLSVTITALSPYQRSVETGHEGARELEKTSACWVITLVSNSLTLLSVFASSSVEDGIRLTQEIGLGYLNWDAEIQYQQIGLLQLRA